MSYHTLTRYRLNIQQYHRMIETGVIPADSRVELIDGEVIHMSPKDSRHAACINKVSEWLGPLVTAAGLHLRIQDPIHLSSSSEPEPDLVLVRRRADFYTDAHPQPGDVLLLIEVADTSLAYDREVKGAMYATAGIDPYWIVNLREGMIEVYSSPTDGRYKQRRYFLADEHLPILGTDTPVADWLI
ncbi:MAG: Uma2 family endonuclease [Bacteroidia bacterium]